MREAARRISAAMGAFDSGADPRQVAGRVVGQVRTWAWITLVIPATADPEHVAENVRAGFGALPDAAMRRRFVKELGL